MSVFHDEVEIEDFEFDEEKDVYHYPCPEMLEMGEDVAQCPSCSLLIRVIYDPEDFVKLETISSKPVAETVN
ncbi:Protein CBR-DPH-3 [Caenorhabditis briggsae]|uniref:Diphthamide biosynthesis protein 3 n=1 Tax=Caenorhabditis briggsae TaxID=6238 RepID=A8Y2T3_CAEBR|nr:Protein CBR-DPH-3 [Caenorhabditis briggsae]CAP39208.2 Protein CBR-DPH-3 [Caenorhabditis briggsae]